MPVILGLFSKVNPKIIIILVIVAAIGYKYYSLSSEISDLESTVSKNTLKISELEKDKMGLKFERDDFEQALENVNAEIDRMSVNEEKNLEELAKWKNRPPEIKFKTIYKEIPQKVEVYKKGECKDGLELNRVISEMSYEDL